MHAQANQNRKRFNRSLTEVRPDAYIFDDGLHFEVRTVQEEDEVPRSHETLNEQHQQQVHQQQQQTQPPPPPPPPQQQQHQSQLASHNLRKASVVSEDSDIFLASDKVYGAPVITGTEPITIKPPYLSIKGRHETTSTESKDTLTPIEAITEPQIPVITSCAAATTTAAAAASISVVDDDEDASTENIMELNFETARQKAQRRRSVGMGRRLSSECCSNYDLNRSQTSLNAALAMSRRQLSLTQSEPDSGNEMTGIRITVRLSTRNPNAIFHITHTHTSFIRTKTRTIQINRM